ncbi:MAG: hypothetical protein WAV15_03405 [Minisyncoccia bacterium]
MKNKIKEITYSVLVAAVVLVLGLAPAGEKTLLALRWGDMGVKMAEAGVIDMEKFEELYAQRGGLREADRKLLTESNNESLVISAENSGMTLNMLWAFGLANKNPVLEKGQMMDSRYGGAGNFASTGGWTLAKGDAMDHYSMHQFLTLSPEQQELVERTSLNIFRPCCGNSTHFPDCNHGMAMLGLLELMASQGVTEGEIYKKALEVNSLWFPEQYQNMEAYFASKNMAWGSVDPKVALGAEYSSSSGYQKMMLQMQPQEQKGGGSCGA